MAEDLRAVLHQSVPRRVDGGISGVGAVYRGPPSVWNPGDPCTRLRVRTRFPDPARLRLRRPAGALDQPRSGVPGRDRFRVALDTELTSRRRTARCPPTAAWS